MLFLLFLTGFSLIAGQDHDIVFPRMTVSRSGEKRIQFRAFDRDFHLRLEPTDIVGDNFVLITRDVKALRLAQPDIEHLKRSVYQDVEAGATISIDENGPLRMKGIINHDLHIEPHHEIHRENVFTSKYYKGGEGHKGRHYGGDHGDHHDGHKDGHSGGHHGRLSGAQGRTLPAKEIPHRITRIIPRTNEESEDNYIDEILPPGVKGQPPNMTEEQREARDSIMVEVGVVSDVNHSACFKSDDDCIVYHMIQYNAVMLRYKSMNSIDVKFQIAALKRNKEPMDEPYFTSYVVDGYASGYDVIYAFADYCANDPIFHHLDIVHFVTKKPIGMIYYDEEKEQKINPNLLGVAFIAGICDDRFKYAVSEDNGCTFDGTRTVAHENAHLLGSPHDGEPPVQYVPGCPGSKECPWDDGYLMSYITNDQKQFKFSRCSDACVAHLSKFEEVNCLFRKDLPDTVMRDDRLPGEYMSDTMGTADMETYYRIMCEKMHPNEKEVDVLGLPHGTCKFACKAAHDDRKLFWWWSHDCIDGSPCDDNKICKNGYCVN